MIRKLLLGATAAMAIGFTATPADAAPYRVIRWDVTRICQIWDFGLPTRPWPSNYAIVSKRLPTLGAALAAERRLWRSGRCIL
jgi:hypothetical protein